MDLSPEKRTLMDRVVKTGLSPEKLTAMDMALSKVTSIGKTPSMFDIGKARVKRAGSLVTQGLINDVPFLRKALPREVSGIEPYYDYEQPIKPLTTLGRDIYGLKGIEKLGVLRTGLRGAGIGMATAGTEEPEDIAIKGMMSTIGLPILKKGTMMAAPFIEKTAGKVLKSTQQAWQDFIRAGWRVEKDSVKTAQEKGINYLMNKKNGFRDSDAFLRLGEDIHNKTMELRRNWGDTVGRWRDLLFKDTRVKVSLNKTRDVFNEGINESGILSDYGTKQAVEFGKDTVENRLAEIKTYLDSGIDVTPQVAYRIIDKINDLLTAGKKGIFSLGKNEGRILANTARALKEQILRSAPSKISRGLKTVEDRFGEVADITDDVFDKLAFVAEGVARKERIGAAEATLKRGLQADTSAQERNIWKRLDNLLPKDKKFMDLYKTIHAAQDFNREGTGWWINRFVTNPKWASKVIGAVQPIMGAAGKALEIGYNVAKKATTPILLRKMIEKP